LECLPKHSPWWEIKNESSEWEVWLPAEQQVCDANARYDVAQKMILRMNGFATSGREANMIRMTHAVDYTHESGRYVSIPLQLLLKNTQLSGFGNKTGAKMDFEHIHPDNHTAIAELMDYWGQPNSETYEGLYKIYECIESSAPDLVSKSISNNKKKRMKLTCNHWSQGPTTRHVQKAVPAPVDPMEISEIREIIHELSAKYLDSLIGTSIIPSR
jgi:hypothetical protein